MKKFIINLIYFGIMLLIVNTVFYIVVYQAYYKGYEKNNLTFKSYLLADSHGTALKNYTEEYGVYNFSAPSDSYFDSLIKVKYLIKNTEVKRIILSVDDHTLSPYRETFNNIQRSTYYIVEEDYKTMFSKMTNGLKRFLVLFNPGIRDIIRLYVQSTFLKGQKSKEWALLSNSEKIKSSVKRFNFQFNFPYPSKALSSSLHEIINICKENNIELIGIQFPLTHVYLETKKNKSFHADKIFRDNNLKVYDFREFYSNQNNYFLNQDHLNELGSKTFIKALFFELK